MMLCPLQLDEENRINIFEMGGLMIDPCEYIYTKIVSLIGLLVIVF